MEFLVLNCFKCGPFAVFLVHAFHNKFRFVTVVVNKDNVRVPSVKLFCCYFREVGVFFRAKECAACKVSFVPAVFK